MHTYRHTNIKTYIHTYIHTNIQAYIHTYIHTYLNTLNWIGLQVVGDVRADAAHACQLHFRPGREGADAGGGRARYSTSRS